MPPEATGAQARNRTRVAAQAASAFGVDPRAFDIIVAKGVIAPIAAYREVVTRIIHVNTAGVTCADMKRLDYTNRRRPMWPFEEI